MKWWKKIAATLSLGAACMAASAAPVENWPDTGPNQWTSVITWDGGRYVNGVQPLVYTHAINGSGGYTPGTLLSGFDLSIAFSDDTSDRRDLWKRESAYIAVPELLFADGSGDLSSPRLWTHDFGPIAANFGLFFDGKLTVSITVSANDLLGDFYVRSSTLSAHALNQVPEPGAIALLAIGLFGVAVVSMRKRSA